MNFWLLLAKFGPAIGKAVTGLCAVIRFFTRRKPARGIVLIVEDCPNDTLLLQRKLDKLGWQHRHAKDGETAEYMVLDKHFDCALVDLQLPGMSGVEVVQSISGNSPRTRVAVVTGYPGMLKGHSFNCRVMSKDVGLEELRRWLEKETL